MKLKTITALTVTKAEYAEITVYTAEEALEAVKQNGYALQYADRRLVVVDEEK